MFAASGLERATGRTSEGLLVLFSAQTMSHTLFFWLPSGPIIKELDVILGERPRIAYVQAVKEELNIRLF